METGSWYEHAIIYRVDIPAFCDGDEDGVGDFQGLIQKLPYLEALGVTCVDLLAVNRTQCTEFIRFHRAARNNGIRTLVQCSGDPRRYGELTRLWLTCGADGVVLPRAERRCRTARARSGSHPPTKGGPNPTLFVRINGVAVPCGEGHDPIRELGAFRAQIVPALAEALRRERGVPLLGLVIRLALRIAGGRLRYQDECDEGPDGAITTAVQDSEPLRLARCADGFGPRLDLLHGLLFALPGPPTLLFGDEIGIDDVVRGPDGHRSPMRWRRGPDGDVIPVEDRSGSSLLNLVRTLARLRRRSRALTSGDARPVSYGAGPGVAFLRECCRDVMLIVANLSSQPRVVECDLSGHEREHLEDVVAGRVVSPVLDAWHSIALGPYGWQWLRLVTC
jgi:hypothetical protein